MTKVAMFSGTLGGYAAFGVPDHADLGWSMLVLSCLLLFLGMVRGRPEAVRIPTVTE